MVIGPTGKHAVFHSLRGESLQWWQKSPMLAAEMLGDAKDQGPALNSPLSSGIRPGRRYLPSVNGRDV